jgi:hypothetical protein
VLRATWVHPEIGFGFYSTGLSPSTARRSNLVPLTSYSNLFYISQTLELPESITQIKTSHRLGDIVDAPQPQQACPLVWALPLSLAATYGISSISFPPVTKMFQFTGFPSQTLCIQIWMTRHDSRRISPFGYPRIVAFVQLPAAFRRLRVLLRQFVPRHSPHTLHSLLVASISFLMRVPLVDMQLSKCSLSRKLFFCFPGRNPVGKEELYQPPLPLSTATGDFF